MIFDALFSAIVEHGAIKETTLLYEELTPIDKATIEREIKMYMITFDVNLGDIHDQILVSIIDSLSSNRKEVMVEEEKIRK